MNDIRNTILKAANTITKTSTELLKSTKLSVSLASEEDKLKALYVETGKKVHEIYMFGGSLGKAFDELIKRIEEQEERIKGIRNQLEIVKGTRTCTNCGKTIDRYAEFCPKCGQRAADARPVTPIEASVGEPEPAPPQEPVPRPDAELPAPEAETPEAGADIKRCGACGQENEKELKFCLYCGRIL